MKKIFAFVFLLVCASSFAQQITLRATVKDALTSEPIISASIGIKNSSIGTITNEEGVFQLTAPKSGSIIISYLGYKTLTIPVSDFTDQMKIIFLEQSEEVLEEVMITKVPLYEILQEVMDVSTKRFNRPIVLNTYYREFVKSDNKYTKFSDGLLDYHINGSGKKIKSDLIVKQNRSISLVSDEDQDEAFGSVLNVQRGILNSYNFAFVSKSLLEDDAYDAYDFTLKSKKDKEGNEFFCIVFEPKPEVEKTLLKGTITYDPKTKLIFDIDMSFAPSHLQYAKTINILLFRLSILDVKFKAAYKMTGNNYVLAFNNRYAKLRVWNKKHNVLLESRSDLIVTNFGKDDLAYNKKEIFKRKQLYQKPSQYTDKFWNKNNAIVLTAEEEQIINNLEKESTTTTN